MSGNEILSRPWAWSVAGRSVALAVELVHGGAKLVVVGGTAHWLTGASRLPRDLDVAVVEGEVPTLVSALAQIGVHISSVTLLRCRQVGLSSAWGPIDIFVEEALPPADVITIGSCDLAVAHE